jgi:tRNA 2-thiouridine synthesizing protein E
MSAIANVQLDADGFLVNSDDWTREIAEEFAREAGIELTDRHWEVIEFCRKDAAEKGTPPTVRRITKVGGVPTKEMYQLFPGGPGILAAKLSGLTKPKGCI